MSWHGIIGHDAVVERFRRALQQGWLASSFLFVGPSGIGKRSFALKLAQALLCSERPEAAMDPCGQCPSCLQAAAGTHPDIHQVSRPEGKANIPLALLIGDREHRHREGLCYDISLKPSYGGRKIAIIDDADYLDDESPNALLKTLEEPPPRSVLILIGVSAAKQLPTIRSRCQLVRFAPLPKDTVAELLVSRGIVKDAAAARRMAEFSDGSIQRAVELRDERLWTFRDALRGQLAAPPLDCLKLARTVTEFVEEAGKEAAARRERLRLAVGFAAEFYRGLLRTLCGANGANDMQTRKHIERAIAAGVTPAQSADRVSRCLEALTEIDANANQSTLIECWIDDLAK
jgi:DNA polymerase-3 subunit delta'